MFKRKRNKSDAKITSDAAVGGSRSDFLGDESNAREDRGSFVFEASKATVETTLRGKRGVKNKKSISDERDSENPKSAKAVRTFGSKADNDFGQPGQVQIQRRLDASTNSDRTPIDATKSNETWREESTDEKTVDLSHGNEASFLEMMRTKDAMCQCSDDYLDFGDEKREDNTRNYSSFLRGMDGRATARSTFIQSDDSYERLRYSPPMLPERWKKRKEGFYSQRENGTGILCQSTRVPVDFSPRMKRRDMETRNSNDIIISGSFKNARKDSEESYRNKKNCSRRKEFELDRENIRQNKFDTRDSDSSVSCRFGQSNSTKQSIISSGSAENEARTETGRNLMTIITICSSKEKVTKVLKRNCSQVRESKSSRRFPENNEMKLTEEVRPSAKRREFFNESILVADACCLATSRGGLSDLPSSVNNFSLSKTLERSGTCRNLDPAALRFKEKKFQPFNLDGSRNSCRCGNGCGTSQETTCNCKKI